MGTAAFRDVKNKERLEGCHQCNGLFCLPLRLLHWNNSEAQSALRQAYSSPAGSSHPRNQRAGAGHPPLPLHAPLPDPGRFGAQQTALLLPGPARPQPQLRHRLPGPAAHKRPVPQPAGSGRRAGARWRLRPRTNLVTQQGLLERRGLRLAGYSRYTYRIAEFTCGSSASLLLSQLCRSPPPPQTG